MPEGTIGVHVVARDAAGVVEGIVRAEELGIPAVWLTTGGVAPDGLTVLAAAAVRTQRVLMGTAIVSLIRLGLRLCVNLAREQAHLWGWV